MKSVNDLAASDVVQWRLARSARLALIGGRRGAAGHALVYVFVIVPFLAIAPAVPYAWGWSLSWLGAAMAVRWYTITMLGITVGFHRYFTHGSFKTGRLLRVSMAVAGSMAVEGPIIQWVATHRRHHAFADRPGDPHSPWRFGASLAGLLRGIWHAHVGWLFSRDLTNRQRFAPDLLADEGPGPAHVAVQ